MSREVLFTRPARAPLTPEKKALLDELIVKKAQETGSSHPYHWRAAQPPALEAKIAGITCQVLFDHHQIEGSLEGSGFVMALVPSSLKKQAVTEIASILDQAGL